MTKQLPALTEHQIPAFLFAVEYNRAMIKRQMNQRRICDADYFFCRTENGVICLDPPGSHTMDTCRLTNDYVAGAIVGALPFKDLHGSDGIEVAEDGTLSPVELKLNMSNPDRFGINENGKISVKDSPKTVGFKSTCGATYEIIHNLDNKNVKTYFVLVDAKEYRLIDIYSLEGDKVIELLGNDSITGETRTARKRSIGLTTFMKHGNRVEAPLFNPITIEGWEENLYRMAGRDPKEAEGYWTKEREELLLALKNAGRTIKQIMPSFEGKTKSALQGKITQLRKKAA